MDEELQASKARKPLSESVGPPSHVERLVLFTFCFAQDLLYKHASDLPADVSVNVPINYPDEPLSRQ